MLKLAISGHRPHKLLANEFAKIKCDLRERLEIMASNEAIELNLLSGMALGVDLFAAKVASQLKIPFEAFIPFESYDSKWNSEDRNELQRLLAKAKKVIIVCETPSKFAFIKRDEVLVQNCDQLLAYLKPELTDSGTAQTVGFAKKLWKPVKLCWPCQQNSLRDE